MGDGLIPEVEFDARGARSAALWPPASCFGNDLPTSPSYTKLSVVGKSSDSPNATLFM